MQQIERSLSGQHSINWNMKRSENLLYLDHHAGLRRLMMPLKITLITHQDEKLIPVAGGTRLMAPNATGQDT